MVEHWRVCCVFTFAFLFWSICAATATQSQSYTEILGKQTSIADKVAELIGVEDPLQPADVARLTSAFRHACADPTAAATKYRLDVIDLVRQYGRSAEQGGHIFDQRAVEQVCAALMACQLDESCAIGDAPASGLAGFEAAGGSIVSNWLRIGSAVALFLEALAGVYIPVLLTGVEGYEWWLSLLNCFSGGIFLTTGLVHLLPHCAESQARLHHLVGDYPLYLVLITVGYMLVLFIERVLFDVHGSEHGHGPHTGIAPPCIDCRTASAEAETEGTAGSEGDLRRDAAAADVANGQHLGGVAVAAGPAHLAREQPPGVAAEQLTPGRTRYNLRSTNTAAVAGELQKPLLPARSGGAAADQLDHDAAAAAQASPVAAGAGHGHGHHGHVHLHHQQHHHQPSLVPVHHHPQVSTGDLTQGVILLVAMTVHTFLECMALGLMDLRREFLMLFMAIASHKLISGLALSSRFLKEGATTRQITLYVGPFAFVAPAAILVGMFVRDVNPIVHLCLSCFATGTFLYVGASEIVEEEFEGDMRSGRTDISQVFARWCKFGMLLLGVAAIAVLSMVPDAHDHGTVHPQHAAGLMAGAHHHHHHHHHH
eukprot:gene10088-10243_t